MNKVKNTPIQDKINRSTIKAILNLIKEFMLTIREAENEEIKEYNNNYYVYKINYSYIRNYVKFLDSDYIYGLLSKDEKIQLRNILNELNLLSVYFNVNIKHFNDSEKRKSIFERAHLKPIKPIVVKHFAKERY